MNHCRAAALASLLAVLSFDVQALGHLADVSVIDRETGQVLSTHYCRGEYWIAGRPGARYAIAIRNHSGERVLAVTAVDGVNVVTGDSASWSQSGYVYEPWQSYEIKGWRKSDAEVAAFEFTAAPTAYATLTGRPANLGVIGVALFRERAPAVPELSAAPSALAEGGLQRAARNSAPLDRLGTGHGQREPSAVTSTGFERLQQQPNEIIRIRYDSLSNLVAMGVVRQSGAERPDPDAFPESPVARYVPDPPRSR